MAILKYSMMDKDVPEGTFICGNNSIESLISSTYYATLLQQAYGYKVIWNDIIVGYYMIYPKKINFDVMESIEGDEYNSGVVDCYNAVHIGYLAIDKTYQGNHIGTYVLKGIISSINIICKSVPFRMITIDALGVYHDWYQKIGFRDIPNSKNNDDIIPMYMDCISDEHRILLDEYCKL